MAQEKGPQKPAALFVPPEADASDKVLPINLPTALKLANARTIDIGLASERIRAAMAQLEQANVLWLPTVYIGADYFRYDGQTPTVQGNVIGASKSTFMLGGGPVTMFALADAIFTPLSARQVVRASQASFQAAANDSLLQVAEAYFNVQQARGELSGALDAAQRTQELVRRTEHLSKQLAPPVEVIRAREELSERLDDVDRARERWRTSIAELVRILRLDPTTLVQPLEPAHLQMTLLRPDQKLDDLIPVALTNRPELAAQQALVQATLERLRQERFRPLVPSIVLRPATSTTSSLLAAGLLGGGTNSFLGNFGARSDFDLQVLWEFQNLGFGNRAQVKLRRSDNQQAVLELFRTQDRVAAEAARAFAQVQSAGARVERAEKGLKDALDSVNKNFEGLGQTKLAGNLVLLVVRPPEVVAAVQALVRAYNRYYGAVADYNRAQFRLYRALGQPGQLLAEKGTARDCFPSPSSVPTDISENQDGNQGLPVGPVYQATLLAPLNNVPSSETRK
jgi:outer membrane protein TolC